MLSSWRKVRPFLLCAALLMLTLFTVEPAAAQAETSKSHSTPQRPTANQPIPLPFKPIAGAPKAVKAPTAAPSVAASCPNLRKNLAKLAARGVRKAGCLVRASQQSSSKTGVAVEGQLTQTADAQSSSSLWCDTDTADEWWITRTTGCITGDPFTFDLYDTENGELIGHADLTFSDSIVLNPSSSEFTETNYITMVDEDNVPELLVTYSGQCDSLCAPLNATAESDAPLTPGATVSGDTTYNDAPPSASTDTVALSNEITMTVPDGEPISPASVSGGPEIRCDTGLAVQTSTGCVYPQVNPTVLFSLSSTGSTAAIDDWAMTNEDAHWGYYGQGNPLTRITDQTKINANRTAICGDGTYQPLYQNDSCEEYAFASTEQSGGNNGLTGADCAMVEATNNNGQWYITEMTTVTGSEGCVIGHADQTSQNSQGGTLSTFYQQNRVIAGDQYWVSISS